MGKYRPDKKYAMRLRQICEREALKDILSSCKDDNFDTALTEMIEHDSEDMTHFPDGVLVCELYDSLPLGNVMDIHEDMADVMYARYMDAIKAISDNTGEYSDYLLRALVDGLEGDAV